jgi:hypothetical protein
MSLGIAWFLAGGWRYVVGAAAVLGVAWLGYAIYNAGYESAEGKCEAAALQAKIEKLELELKVATDLATSSAETVKQLQAGDEKAQVRQQELQNEIDKLRQATTAKPAANPLVSGRGCNLTDRGVQFFTRAGRSQGARAATARLPAAGAAGKAQKGRKPAAARSP